MSIQAYLSSLKDVSTPFQSRDITLKVQGKIGWLIFDLENRPVNVVNLELLPQVEQVFDIIDKMIKNRDLYALIFVSGKAGTFIAGADITAMYPNVDQNVAVEGSKILQKLLNRIEAFPIISIAAINGAALGAGLELALACTYRLASSDPRVSLGLPEVKLGLLPGSGGTVRLPRVVGLQAALGIILPGGSVKANKAKNIGLVDGVIESTDRLPNEHRFYSQVRAFATQHINPSTSSSSLLSHKRHYPSRFWTGSLKDRFLDGTAIGHWIVADQAVKTLDKQSKGHYPAPYFALDSAVNSVQDSSASHAFNVEADYFGRLAVTPESKNLMSLFFMMEESKKRKERFGTTPPIKVKTVGIIGAGVMGAQIATLLASKGIKVYMRDINKNMVDKGLEQVKNHFNDKVKKGKMKSDKAELLTSHVTAGTDLKGLADCQLVIEAAIEKMDVKKKILIEWEQLVNSHNNSSAIFATNTSSLSITELASVSSNPSRVIGIHFFNPVLRMPLVEIITSTKTSEEVTATGYQIVLDIGKIPVVCADAAGFIVNRILGVYMNEAGHLAMEGKSISTVDKSFIEFGLPMGPFRLMDEVGLDVAAHVGPILHEAFGLRYTPIPSFKNMLDGAGGTVLGKKTKLGFYVYDDKGKEIGINKILSAELGNIVTKQRREEEKRTSTNLNNIKSNNRDRFERKGKELNEEIVDRCVLLMVNEAAYILSEKVVTRPEDIDLAMIMGTGFAPFRGGLLAYADARGLDSIVTRLLSLQKELGPRFKPHPLLIEMSKEGKRFYPNRPDARKCKKITNLPRSKL